MLTARQNRLYRNRADLLKPRYEIDPGRKIQVDTDYDLMSENEPCLYVNNQSPEQPEPMGRVEQMNIFTRDEWHFDIETEIGSGWIIRDRTIDRYGNPSPWFGTHWIVQGTSQNIPSLGGRNTNMRIVRANVIPNAPRHVV